MPITKPPFPTRHPELILDVHVQSELTQQPSIRAMSKSCGKKSSILTVDDFTKSLSRRLASFLVKGLWDSHLDSEKTETRVVVIKAWRCGAWDLMECSQFYQVRCSTTTNQIPDGSSREWNGRYLFFNSSHIPISPRSSELYLLLTSDLVAFQLL